MVLPARRSLSIVLLAYASTLALAQQNSAALPSPLDAARALTPASPSTLTEEYIWTAGDVTALRPDHASYPWSRQNLRVEPHLFRRVFNLPQVPPEATLYVAGPRDAEIYLNGKLLAHFASNLDAPIGLHVFHVDASKVLLRGRNILAIRAIRGRGIVSADASPATSQLTYGEVLAVKLLAARPNRTGPVLLISDRQWRSHAEPATTPEGDEPWSSLTYKDTDWQPVFSLGPVEANNDFRQWSADAGMYAWPGYEGISGFLGTYALAPTAVTHVFSGNDSLAHIDALTSSRQGANFTIQVPVTAQAPTDAEAPSLLLDFGREVAGRIRVTSASGNDALLSIAYGESELEALATGLTPEQRGGNYLGLTCWRCRRVARHAALRARFAMFVCVFCVVARPWSSRISMSRALLIRWCMQAPLKVRMLC